MSTMDRAKMSKKNPYYLPMHRYRELRHHCLQYPEWQELYHFAAWPEAGQAKVLGDKGYVTSPIEDIVLLREVYLRRIQLIERVVRSVDADIYRWLLKGVTEEVTYEWLRLMLEIPMSRNSYYQRYHKFYWLLDKMMTEREKHE